MTEVLVRITAPRFVAGLIASNGRVVRAAPILRRHVMGKTGAEVAAICARKGWKWETVR